MAIMQPINRLRLWKSVLCLSLLGGSLQGRLVAQEKGFESESKTELQVSASVTQLDAAARRVVASMESRDRYRVSVIERWSLDGTTESSGVNQFNLSVWPGGAFDLKIDSQGGSKQSLECHSDGLILTRMLDRPSGMIYSQKPGSLIHVSDDVLTETSLRNSGLDLLFRESPEQYLMTMAADVEYLGSEDVADVKAEHFRFNWAGDPANRKEVWFTLDEAPRLMKVVSTIEFAAGQDVKHILRVESELRWEAGREMSEEPVALELPDKAQQVSDLYGYLLEGGTRQLIGQAAPQPVLELLDGTKWDLSRHRDHEFVVLYFFASWAAPSLAEMPVILEFIDKFEPKGVAFYAVNVGEAKPTVQAFVQAQGYSHPVVLDGERQAAAAFGVTSLPEMVLIGKDGTIKSAHVGNTPEVRALVRQEVEQLLGIQANAE